MEKRVVIVFLSLSFFSCKREFPNKTLKEVNYYFNFNKPINFLCEKKIVGSTFIPIGPTDFKLFVYAKLGPEDHKIWLKKLRPFQCNFTKRSYFSIRKWYPKLLISNLTKFNRRKLNLSEIIFYKNVDLMDKLEISWFLRMSTYCLNL
jgi:hypothetical protein